MTKPFILEDWNYLRFRDLIQDRTGMFIGENRRNVLTRALRESARNARCADLGQLLVFLEACKTDSEVWDDLVRKLTIGETYFFRHQEQIEALRRNILPDLIARHWNDHTLCLWSAGCATGEEPYTLAILLRDLLSDIERWKILILATDINRQALTRAAAGRYRDWSFRETDHADQAFRAQYFKEEEDHVTLDPSIRKMVTFSYLNLAEDKYPSPETSTSHLDLILCRNVRSRLPHSVSRDISDRFYQCLNPGGWLMVGPSETHLEIYSKFQMLVYYGSIVYQKIEGVTTSRYPQTGFQESSRSPVSVWSPAPAGSEPSHKARLSSLSKSSASTPPVGIADRRPPLAAPPMTGKTPPLAHGPRQTVPTTTNNPGPYEQGQLFLKHRRYVWAPRSFLACLEGEPDSLAAQFKMAYIEANSGHLDEARAWAEKALRRNPLRSEVHYVLAIISEGQGKPEEAIASLKKVIYLDPDFVLAHLNLFHVYNNTGRKNEAERNRTLAIRLASTLSPDMVLPGSDDLTAEQLVSMARVTQGRSDNTPSGSG